MTATPILTEGDLLYIAGLFDGEGSAGVYKHADRRMKRAQVCMGMTDPDPIRFLALCFGGKVYEIQSNLPNRKLRYDWRLADRRALGVANQLLPYVKNLSKVKQLTSIVEYFNMRDINKPKRAGSGK